MRNNEQPDWPPTRESVANWLRRHSAMVAAFAMLAVAALSILSLVVAESRLRDLDGDGSDRASSATTPSTSAARATEFPSGPDTPSGMAGEVLDATNTDRVNGGLAAVRWNSDLAGSAQQFADQMAATALLDHQDLSGVLALGFHSAAQNVLVGPAGLGADAAEAGWMNSPTHRATIVNSEYTDVGVGVATSADGRIWIAVTFAG